MIFEICKIFVVKLHHSLSCSSFSYVFLDFRYGCLGVIREVGQERFGYVHYMELTVLILLSLNAIAYSPPAVVTCF